MGGKKRKKVNYDDDDNDDINIHVAPTAMLSIMHPRRRDPQPSHRPPAAGSPPPRRPTRRYSHLSRDLRGRARAGGEVCGP